MAKSLAGHALAFLTAVAIASIALTWVTLGLAAYYVPLPLRSPLFEFSLSILRRPAEPKMRGRPERK